MVVSMSSVDICAQSGQTDPFDCAEDDDVVIKS